MPKSEANKKTRRGRPPLHPRAYNIAARLNARRQELGLSAGDVAREIGVTSSTYRAWERQVGPQVEAAYLASVAQALGTTLAWLQHGTEPKEDLKANSQTSLAKTKMSPEERTRCALRAKARRVSLNLTRADLASHIAAAPHTVASWERMLPLRSNAEIEAQWENTLGVPAGWLRSLTSDASTGTENFKSTQIAVSAATVAEEIRQASIWLARRSRFSRTLERAVLTPAEYRHAEVFALRYGVEGEAMTTLQAIGDRYAITRERIRQIVAKMTNRIPEVSLLLPSLDRLRAEMKPLLPAPIEKLDAHFRALLGEQLSIESADRFSREVLGKSLVSITDSPWDGAARWSRTAVDTESHDAVRVRAIRDASMKMIRNCGAAQTYFVAGAVSEALGAAVAVSEMIRSAQLVPGFEWIIEADGWFWYGPQTENRLLTVTEKVLASTSSRVDVELIMGALLRSRRANYEPEKSPPYNIAPTMAVVAGVLRRTPWIKTVQSDDFLIDLSPLAEDVLSPTELAIRALMAERGNTASRHTLTQQLVDTGIVQGVTLGVTLDGSPIFEQIDRGVFALRGAPIDPAHFALEKESVGGLAARRTPIQPKDEEGFIAFDFQLSDYMIHSRFFSAPKALAHKIPIGNYSLAGSENEIAFAKLKAGDYRFRRLIGALHRMGFEKGDWVRMRIHPDLRHVQCLPLEPHPDDGRDAMPLLQDELNPSP